MFSKIRDLDRYKQDQKRFKIAIDSTEGEIKDQGRKLLANLNTAVEGFDNVMDSFVSDPNGTRMDHATAQKMIVEAKNAIEHWVAVHAPNIHVENS